MGSRRVRQFCKLDAESTGYLEHAMEETNFSARAYDRILKGARTLADLSGAPDIRASDILKAIQYRALDRTLFSWWEKEFPRSNPKMVRGPRHEH